MSLDHFGSYEILRRLASSPGGLIVFQARDVDLDRLVALKRAYNPIAATHLLAEAEAMAAVQHPHVLPVLDFGEEAKLPTSSRPPTSDAGVSARNKRAEREGLSYTVSLKLAA